MGLLSKINAALSRGSDQKTPAPKWSLDIGPGGGASGPVLQAGAGSTGASSWSIDIEAGS